MVAVEGWDSVSNRTFNYAFPSPRIIEQEKGRKKEEENGKTYLTSLSEYKIQDSLCHEPHDDDENVYEYCYGKWVFYYHIYNNQNFFHRLLFVPWPIGSKSRTSIHVRSGSLDQYE